MMRKLASVTRIDSTLLAEHRLGEAELMLGNPLAAPNLENQKAGQDSGNQNQQAADQQFLTSAALHLPGAGVNRLAQSIFQGFHRIYFFAGERKPCLRAG
jgi:predicted S18 family serine protease